jgi:large subunit ribosomal protein L19|uniref:50S ribosomal protein L19 n=2 Tax=Cyanidioschyzon merolae TaxID=45157 RepID=Q85G07_CYAM1|nr:ribosomal protein L19 [Cyanidioschyzon merolae strain 10D]QFV16980.1 50S ribosomal protein L19 [Cyanidioschyzon merolae]QFV17158.1 50S ribosomal protein L19 [Cyanidioschyzon merolae]BAC76184.1 50S ribosomal protein L19 [Cyanidioschyzon merolae strain 10D]
MCASEIQVGDQVRFGLLITEGEKQRVQYSQGIVIARTSKTVTIRSLLSGVGVERILYLDSPLLAELKVVQHNRVRRAKLYYLRRQ